MADEVELTEDEAFGNWLSEMNEEEPEAVDEETPVVERVEKKVDALIREKQTDDLIDKFSEKASEEAKRLFDIYRRGDEDPKQLKALMELAVVKAKEAAPVPEEVEQQAEKRADEIAKEHYGVGPLASGGPVPEMTPEEEQRNALFRRVQAEGDPRALLGLLAEDSEFVDAVLTGKALRKR